MPHAENESTGLYFEDLGAGDPILLIPGLGGSSRQVAAIAAELSTTHRVIAVDPRGAGQSDKPDMPYDGALLARDMIAVLDRAGIAAAHVAGISMGGMIAQELAVQHGARVRSLLLASTYAAADAWSERMWAVREGMIRHLGLAEHFQLALMFLFSPGTFRREAETVKTIEAAFAASPPDPVGYLRQLQFCRSHNSVGRLGRIGARTLVVTGAEDILCTPLQGRELAAAIPGARYREMPDVAHLFMLSNPAGFAVLLREFLAGEAGAATGKIFATSQLAEGGG